MVLLRKGGREGERERGGGGEGEVESCLMKMFCCGLFDEDVCLMKMFVR